MTLSFGAGGCQHWARETRLLERGVGRRATQADAWSAAVKLLVDPAYADELRKHLLRCVGIADVSEEDDPGTLTVTLDETMPPEAARLELDLFFNIWMATRPVAPVEVIEEA